jgi:hypothetical protein
VSKADEVRFAFILNELEFAIIPDVSNPDMNQGWSYKLLPKDESVFWRTFSIGIECLVLQTPHINLVQHILSF